LTFEKEKIFTLPSGSVNIIFLSKVNKSTHLPDQKTVIVKYYAQELKKDIQIPLTGKSIFNQKKGYM
jgi:hypothetical protein